MIDDSLQDDQFYRNNTSLKLVIFVGVIFLLLATRLYYLQIVQYDYHFRLSEKNRVRPRSIQANRGFIYDRNGEVLARNRPSYQICILRADLKDPEGVFRNLMKIKDTLGVHVFDSTRVRRMIQRGIWRKFQPLPILEDAPIEVVSVIEEHQLELQGVVSVISSRREYPFETAAAHVLGYTTSISTLDSATREEYTSQGYELVDKVGIKGIERYYEDKIKGVDGKKFIEVNAYGQELGIIEERANYVAVPGDDLYSTIDIDLQLVAENAFPDSIRGALVAIDPQSGEILAMLSRPRFNGNIFSLVGKRRKKAQKNSNEYHRAVKGTYPPGSTFKALVSLASFKEGQVDPNYMGYKACTGSYKFGKRRQKCWNLHGHGRVNFYKAFQQSCDVYYYQVGLQIGMNSINNMATRFGMGMYSGIDLDGESKGLLIDSASYNLRFKKLKWKWTRGLILNLAIGQGQLITPLQLANMAAGLGNGKVVYKPHLMKRIESNKGVLISKYQPEVLHELGISDEDHKVILEAMRMVVEEPGGTGGRARVPGVIVGGKTGSAENPHGKTHALFIAVAPLYSPEIAIGIIMENAGHGGSMAAPIAGKVLNYFFNRTDNET